MPLLVCPDWVMQFGCYFSAGHCASNIAPGGEYTRTYLTLSIAGKTVVESTTLLFHPPVSLLRIMYIGVVGMPRFVLNS